MGANGKRIAGMLVLAAVILTGCGGGRKRPPARDLEKDPHYHYQWSHEQFRRGHYLEALQAIDKAIALDGEKYVYFNMRGLIYRSAGELDKALMDFRKTLEMNPYFTDAHNNIGAIYAELGRTDEALAEFQIVLKDPMYASREKAYFNSGDLLFAQSRFEESLELYRKALAVRPDYGRAFFKLGKALLELGRKDEAHQAFADTVRVAPNTDEAREATQILEAALPSS